MRNILAKDNEVVRLANLLMFLLLFVFTGCNDSNRNKVIGNKHNSLPYIIDGVHNNPGEGATTSVFNDPAFVKSLGFNGMAPQWHVQCAITYDSFIKGIVPEGSKERKWILDKQEYIKEKLHEAEKTGMPVYAFTDMMVMPTIILEKYKDQIIKVKDSNSLSPIHGKLKPDINQELTQKLIRIQIDEIFKTFPELDGLVIRFGETYLFDTPFHTGGSPVERSGEEGIEGHVKLIQLLKEEICEKRGKKLFYRTWDFKDFFHTNPKVYLAITDQIEPNENLIFSIKHTKGDFHRTFVFNPTLGIGKHQQIVEVQCQREYEGKGAHPDYIAKSVIEGFKEYEYLMEPGTPKCLKDIVNNKNIAGVWTWSRGGGWRGPYITNELWPYLNAYVLSHWAQAPDRNEEEIFNEFAGKIGLKGNDIKLFRQICLLSVDGVFKGRLSEYGDVNLFWTRDEYIHGLDKLASFFDQVLDEGIEEKILEEKEESVKIWEKIEELSEQINSKDEDLNNFLMVSSKYGRIKYEIMATGWEIMLLGYKGDKTGEYDKKTINEAIQRYDGLWEEWKILKDSNPACPTIYKPEGFSMGSDGVSGDKNKGIEASVDKYRHIVKS